MYRNLRKYGGWAANQRRVYTQAHMDVTCEGVCEVMATASQIKGLKFNYEPDALRFFQGRFEQVDAIDML